MRARDDASRAQWELETIRERTLAAKIDSAEQGRWRGGRVPLGYRRAGDSLEIDPEPAAAVGGRRGHPGGPDGYRGGPDLNARLGLAMRPTAVSCCCAAGPRRTDRAARRDRRRGTVAGHHHPRGIRPGARDPARPRPTHRAWTVPPPPRLGAVRVRRRRLAGLPVGRVRNGVVSYAATGVNRRTDLVDRSSAVSSPNGSVTRGRRALSGQPSRSCRRPGRS